MSTYLGDVMAAGDKYISNGEEKTRWIKCGGLFQNDQGKYSVKMDCIPLGSDVGWFRVFEPREQGQRPAAPSQAPAQDQPEIDDDIPF